MSAASAVGAFCAAIGVAPARGEVSLPLVLEFERSGRLHLEEAGAGVVVYLVRPVPGHGAGVAGAVLRAIHPAQGLPFTVKAGFRGEDTLVLLSHLPGERLDTPTLDGVLRLLMRLADEAEAAA